MDKHYMVELQENQEVDSQVHVKSYLHIPSNRSATHLQRCKLTLSSFDKTP
jgi:hypothetical protein